MTIFFGPALLRGLVFDFDGTLATTPLDWNVLHRRAREALAVFAPVLENLQGPVLEDIERVCAALEPATAARARQAAMAAIEEVEVATARKARLFSFVRPMLAELRARGVGAAVITRNCPAAVFTVFPDAREHFRCILTRDDVAEVKPAPGHLLAALSVLRCDPEHSLMIGDHPMDIRTGKGAGTYTAGVASGDTSLSVLAQEEPDFLAGDVGELMRKLAVLV